MLPVAHIIHRVPGRARLKFPDHRGDQGLLDRLAEQLEAHGGVNQVDASGRTGSLLIRHSVSLGEIIAFAEQNALFTLGGELKWRNTLASRTQAHLRTLDERITRSSEGNLDLRSLLIMAFLGLTLTQLIRGQILPPASTLLWYAAQLLGIKGDPNHEGNG